MKAGIVSLDNISNLEELFHKKNPKITFTDKKRYVKSDNEYLLLLNSCLYQMHKFVIVVFFKNCM